MNATRLAGQPGPTRSLVEVDMLKRVITLVLALFVLAGSLGLAMAAEGNSRKGKYLFRKNCRACHVENGQAKDLSPMDLTQAQWKQTFADPAKLKCKDEWAKLSKQDLSDIEVYMVEGAKDSPTPAKCK
jgi:cytochrome c553